MNNHASRRTVLKGRIYFFTVSLAQHHLRLLSDHVEVLSDVVKVVKQEHPLHQRQYPNTIHLEPVD